MSVITHSVFVFKAGFLITGWWLIFVSGLLNNELRKRLDVSFKTLVKIGNVPNLARVYAF